MTLTRRSAHAKKFHGYAGPIRLGDKEIEEAKRSLPADIIKELDFAIERVTAFAQAKN